MKTHVDLAKEAGFETAAKNADADYTLAKKLLVAYATYKVVTDDQINEFNAALRAKTEKQTDRWTKTFKKLALVPIAKYASLPPAEVLEAVKLARSGGLFCGFDVAYIMDEKEVRDPDPIVFGNIDGCSDHFFITQWGDDVKLTDLIANEIETSHDNK